MPSPTRALIFFLLFAALGVGPALAEQGPDLGELFLSFDPAAVVQELDLEANATFDVYLRAQVDFTDVGQPLRNDSDGIKSWEACLAFPPEVTILERIVMLPSFNGADDSCAENWQVVLDGCLRAENTPDTLVRYRCRLDDELTNLEIRVDAASPTSIDGVRPGWYQCVFTGQPTDVHAFAAGYGEPLVINGGVANGASSWSAVKDRY